MCAQTHVQRGSPERGKWEMGHSGVSGEEQWVCGLVVGAGEPVDLHAVFWTGVKS